MLKPLGDVLGVSITELLSGKRIDEVDMKEQADNIILESLNYSKRMLASVISVIIFIIGIAFIISPLFLVSQSYIWTLGLIIVATAILYIYTRKKRDSMKATNNNDSFVLKNEKIQVKKGEAFGIFGKNGSGKTTAVKLLIGLYPTSENGEVTFNGVDINKLDMEYMRGNKISYVMRCILTFTLMTWRWIRLTLSNPIFSTILRIIVMIIFLITLPLCQFQIIFCFP